MGYWDNEFGVVMQARVFYQQASRRVMWDATYFSITFTPVAISVATQFFESMVKTFDKITL